MMDTKAMDHDHENETQEGYIARLEEKIRKPQQTPLEATIRELEIQAREISKGIWDKVKMIRKLRAMVAKLEKRHEAIAIEGGGHLAHALLSEEDWYIIMKKLQSPKDLWNCYHTCQQLFVILHPSRITWAFELVLPHIYRLLSGNDMVNCRMVCRRWRDGMNNFLENHPSIIPHGAHGDEENPKLLSFVYPMKEKKMGDRNALTFKNGFDFSRLPGREQSGTNWNPFIGRHAALLLGNNFEIDDDDEEGEDQYWDPLYNFLESFGNEIQNLEVLSAESFEENEDRLKQSLESMGRFVTSDLANLVPNLKKLSIRPVKYRNNEIILDSDSLSLLPKLETLEMLSNGSTDSICEGLIQRHHLQLCRLKVSLDTWSRICGLEWRNIKELHVISVCYYDRDSYRSLLGVRMPNLTKLGLSFPSDSNIEEASFEVVMEILNELSTTTRLTALRLEGLDYGVRFPHMEQYSPAAETLKTLEIQLAWDWDEIIYSSFDFLLVCFPFVENIHIIPPFYGATGLQQEIYTHEIAMMPLRPDMDKARDIWDYEFLQVRKYIYSGQMYKSNIWELLPLLNVFSYDYDIYTRDGYDMYSRNQ